MNKYKLSKETRGSLMSQLFYGPLYAPLTLVALALLSPFISEWMEFEVPFWLQYFVVSLSFLWIVILLFRMFKADWLNYTFEIDSESIIRVWRSGKEDIGRWRDLRSISTSGLVLSFVTEEGRVQALVVDALLKDSLTDFARTVTSQIIANEKEQLLEGAKRRVQEEKIEAASAYQGTSELRWHIYTQIVPVTCIAIGIALHFIVGERQILLALFGLILSIFGFFAVHSYRRYAQRRLMRFEEAPGCESDGDPSHP